MKKYGKIFMNGIIDENPTFRMVLGMCPTLAITTAASNGIGMGLAVTFVLIFSNLVISLLRKAIPDQIRIPAFIVVIATFVTIVQLIIKAFLPALDASLGSSSTASSSAARKRSLSRTSRWPLRLTVWAWVWASRWPSP